MAPKGDCLITKTAVELNRKIPASRMVQATLIGCKASRMHLVPVQLKSPPIEGSLDQIDYSDWVDTRFGGKYLVDTADYKHYCYHQVHEDQDEQGTAYVIFTESQENRRSEHLNLYIRRMTDYNVTWYGNILIAKLQPGEFGGMDKSRGYRSSSKADALPIVRHVLNVVYTEPFRNQE